MIPRWSPEHPGRPVVVVTVVIVARAGITVWRMVLARRGKAVPASKGGKHIVLTLAIAMVLAPLPDWTDWITIPLVLLAVAVTVVTGIQYLLDSRNRSDS